MPMAVAHLVPGIILEPGEDMTFKMIHPSGDVHSLPHARVVSNIVHDGNDTKAATATLLLMQVTLNDPYVWSSS